MYVERVLGLVLGDLLLVLLVVGVIIIIIIIISSSSSILYLAHFNCIDQILNSH